MGHGFTAGTGFMVREPSWHRLEGALLDDWPGSWNEARIAAKLDWEPVIHPVFREGPPVDLFSSHYHQVEGWNLIERSDNGVPLSIQADTYKVISNSEFGKVIEIVLGTNKVKFETLFELWGGKQVVCLVRFENPRKVARDPSETYTFIAFCSRHDGQGGLKATATNVRVVCANTLGFAEAHGSEGKSAFTIRHTLNWGDKIEEVAAAMQQAYDSQDEFFELGNVLSGVFAPDESIEVAAKRLLPIGDDMGMRQMNNRLAEREAIKGFYESQSCDGIRGSYWGVLNAMTEWIDHGRKFRSAQTYTTRTMLTHEPLKVRAFSIVKKMAEV